MSQTDPHNWAFDFGMRRGPGGIYDRMDSPRFGPNFGPGDFAANGFEWPGLDWQDFAWSSNPTPAQMWIAPAVMGAAMLAGAAFITGLAVGYAAGAQSVLARTGGRNG